MALGFQDKHLLVGQVEEYNRRVQLPTFHIKGSFTSDNDLEYEGALRFFLEHDGNNFTKAIRLTSSTTWKDLKPQLYEKFNLTDGVANGSFVPILYAVTNEENSLKDEDRPLVLALQVCGDIHFILRVYQPGSDQTGPPELSKNSKMNQSNKFFAAMKKKLNRGKSKEQIALPPSPKGSATLSRDPISPVNNKVKHGRQKSDNSSIGSRKKSDASGHKASATLALSNAANARSFENLSKVGKTVKKKQKASRNASNSMSNMLAIDDTEEFVTVHGIRAELGVDEVVIPIDGSMTVRDIITDVLDECDISLAKVDDYTLCDVIGREVEGMWLTDYARDMNDNEKPLLLISMMKPSEGLSRRFEIRNTVKDDEATTRDGNSEIDLTFQQRNIQRHASTSLSSSVSNVTDYAASQVAVKFPTDTPYFLTIQSFDAQRDAVIHLVSRTTSIVGSSEDEEECSMQLFAPDILAQHCWVCKVFENEEDFQYKCLSLAPFPGALVKINEQEIHKKTNLKPGDIIAMGHHYMFIFKDPNSSKPHHTNTSALVKRTIQQAPASQPPTQGQLPAHNQVDIGDHWTSVVNSLEHLSLSEDKQNELLTRIFSMDTPSREGFRLMPAYLLALALDLAKHCMSRRDFSDFLTRLCNNFQQTILECAKTLQDHAQEPECNSPKENLDSISHFLQPMFYWTANCIELRAYVSATLTPQGQIADEHAEVIDEAVMVLSDTVTYAFQQTVYHLTKVLYPTLDLILTDNPFSKAHNTASMQDTLDALSSIFTLCSSTCLDIDISQQLIAYLYFFLGTSLCNKMFEQGNKLLWRESAALHYKWEEGVKIRKNLELLEGWAIDNNAETANLYLAKAVAIADFLATSKQFLLQASWHQLRSLYTLLSAAQLRHLLDNYDIGNRPTPPQWCPPSEEIYRIMEESIMVSFDDHPPLVMPSHSSIDLSHDLENKIPHQHLEYVNSFFAQHHSEDETDSGFDLGHSRSPTEVDDHGKPFGEKVKRGSRSSNNSETGGGGKTYTPIFKKKKDSGPTRRNKEVRPKPLEPVILHNVESSDEEAAATDNSQLINGGGITTAN